MSRPITLQQIFNAAWKHFIIGNGKPAYNPENDLCLYEDEKGNKCAVGLKLPKKYRLDNISFPNLVDKYPSLFSHNLRLQGYNKLNYFQAQLHDALQVNGKWNYTKKDRRKQYKKIAKEFNLKIPS